MSYVTSEFLVCTKYQGPTPDFLGSSGSWDVYFFFYDKLKADLVQQKTGRLLAAEKNDTIMKL